MSSQPDHYATLGVAPTSDHVVIRAAFKALMLKYHPDTNKSADATRRAAEINAAFEVLGDPEKRAAYDASCASKDAGAPPPPRPPKSPAEGPKPKPASKAKAAVDLPKKGDIWSGSALLLPISCGIAVVLAAFLNRSETASIPADGSTEHAANDSPVERYLTRVEGNASAVTIPHDGLSPPTPSTGLPLQSEALNFNLIEEMANKFGSVLSSSGMMGARAWSRSVTRMREKTHLGRQKIVVPHSITPPITWMKPWQRGRE